MTSSPNPSGRVLHRICPSCDKDIAEEAASCPTCGSKLVEIRDDIDALIGTVIDDRFEIRDKIGHGGMGTVYRAWQRSIGREVAVKLIDRTFSRDPMGVRRFLREARLASQLSQPNTVSVFDFGQAGDGRLFIAMELIRGSTLAKLVQTEGAFSVERTKRIGVQICDAIEAAHSLGIIHRDLKLENVIVLDHPSGRDLLKVLDFGLAKNIRDPGSNATESGIVVGTPRYMAPEAAMRGESLPAGDVYSLGVMLGELVTGKPLWEGDNLPQLVQQKLDVTTAVAQVPAALRLVIRSMLDPEPERRPTAAAARALLAAHDDGNAGDTILDPSPALRVTANLRAKSEPAQIDDDSARTRQLTPERNVRPVLTPAPASSSSSSSAASASASSPSASLDASFGGGSRTVSRRIGLVAIVGALVAVAVAAVVYVQVRSDSQHGGSRVAAAPADAPLASIEPVAVIDAGVEIDAAPATVTVRIETRPAGAIVQHDGTRNVTPFDLVVTKDEAPLRLTAQLKGYAPLPFTFIPDRDARKSFVLKKLQPKPVPDENAPF